MSGYLDGAKSWLKSKSIWGNILAIASTVTGAVAVAQQIPPEVMTTLIGASGTAIVLNVISIWGRIVAKVKIE
jgi:hypothetical protein